MGRSYEDMEDAGLVRDAGAVGRLRAKVALTEALGSEVVVHFVVDAPKVVTEDTRLLAKEAAKDGPAPVDAGNRFVASFAPRSRVRPGDEVEILVDTERLHLFGPETGLSIRA